MKAWKGCTAKDARTGSERKHGPGIFRSYMHSQVREQQLTRLRGKQSTPDNESASLLLMMMKRPSLFALLSILERIQSSVNRRCSFDEIARSNPKLRNRTATSKYLKLMQALGLVKFESFEQPVRNPWRWRRPGSRGRTLKRYFLTEKGRALLRLFAPLGTESDTTD